MKSVYLGLIIYGCSLTAFAQSTSTDPCSDESTRKEDAICVLSSNTVKAQPASSPLLKPPPLAHSPPLAGHMAPESEFGDIFSTPSKKGLEVMQKDDKYKFDSEGIKGMQVEKSGTRF